MIPFALIPSSENYHDDQSDHTKNNEIVKDLRLNYYRLGAVGSLDKLY